MDARSISTFHTHHQGRALYTLIRPPTDSTSRPEIKHVVMGSDLEAGEVLQLFVPGGWWKASEVPVKDLEEKDEEARSRVGCLISEVVVPGWTPEQHQFIDLEKVSCRGQVMKGSGVEKDIALQLKDMWHGKSGWEDYEKYIQAPK
jgi:predicted cupin superfamily sugar epimerase